MTSLKISKFKILLSYIYPVIVEKTSSPVNHYLEVTLVNGRLYLNTRNANYAFGDAQRKFLRTFRQIELIKMKMENILILGYGVGGISHIIQKQLKISCSITGIELDEKVLELGKKYFSALDYNNLSVHCRDALSFIKEDKGSYNLIVCDIFIDAIVPSEFQTEAFIRLLYDHLNEGGIIAFNKMTHTFRLKKEMENLIQTFSACFNKVEYHKKTDILVARK